MIRFRRRYVLVRLIHEGAKPRKEAFELAMKESIRSLFGESGMVEIDPKIIYYNSGGPVAVIACRLRGINKLRTALAFVTEIGGSPSAVLVLRASGTIRSLKGALREGKL